MHKFQYHSGDAKRGRALSSRCLPFILSTEESTFPSRVITHRHHDEREALALEQRGDHVIGAPIVQHTDAERVLMAHRGGRSVAEVGASRAWSPEGSVDRCTRGASCTWDQLETRAWLSGRPTRGCAARVIARLVSRAFISACGMRGGQQRCQTWHYGRAG